MADSLKKSPDPRDRYYPLIKPSDDAWKEIEQKFSDLLGQPAVSVDTVLSEHFTDHERKLFLPATAPLSLRTIQENNTQRYKSLLAGRFRGHIVSLACKFTMLYFGLPVEPVLAGIFDYVQPDFDVDDGDELRDVEVQPPLHFLTAHEHRNYGLDHMRGKEGPFSTIPIPASQFAEENPELAAQLSGQYGGGHELGLRGGGGNDDDEDEDHDEDMLGMSCQSSGEDGGGCQLSLRGGDGGEEDADMLDVSYQARGRAVESGRQRSSAPAQEEEFTVSTAIPFSYRPSHLRDAIYDNATYQSGPPAPVGNDGPAAPTEINPGFPPAVLLGSGRSSSGLPTGTSGKKQAVRVAKETGPPAPSNNSDKSAVLYGYQGQVTFKPSDLSTFQLAARRLLSLKTGDHCDIALAHLDRTSQKVLKTFEADLPLGSEHQIAKYLREASEKDAEKNANNAWFVYRRGESAPTTWEPRTADFLTTLTKLRRVNSFGGHDIAYLKMPRRYIFFGEDVPGYQLPPTKPWGVNMYMPFLATAQEVLVGKPDRPGDGHCDIRIAGSDNFSNDWFGGLEINNLLFNMIHPHIAKRKTFDVEARPLPKDTVVFCLPGSINTADTLQMRQCPRGDKSGGEYATALKVVNQMTTETGLPGEPPSDFRIWRGSDFFNTSVVQPDLIHPPHDWSPHVNNNDQGQKDLAGFIAQAVNDTSAPCRFFVIQPADEDRRLTICNPAETRVQDFPPEMIRMNSFKAKVQKLYEGDAKTQYEPEKDTLILEPVLSPEDAQRWNQPPFVLRANATDAELTFVRRYVFTSMIRVSVIKDDSIDFVKQLDKQSLWGPRYGEISRFREELGLPSVVQPTKPAPPVPKAKTQTQPKPQTQSKTQSQTKSKTESSFPRKQPRELYWAEQPSIFGKGIYNPSIPINAPPVEDVMRTGGNRVPMVTKNVLTATEQRRLQEDFWTIRGMTLDRLSKCPYEKCRFTYRIDEEEELVKHMQSTHVGNKCPWCDVQLFQHWSAIQRQEHFKEAHEDELRKALETTAPPPARTKFQEAALKISSRARAAANKPSTPPPPSVFQILERASRPVGLPPPRDPPTRANGKEVGYLFCDRCGRDHKALSNKADREHHDRQCVPNAHASGRCGFCKACGDIVWKTSEDAAELAPFEDYPHSCRGTSHPNKPHCTKCGFSMRELSNADIDAHRKHCGGFFGTLGCFCPYCQRGFVKDGVRAPVDEVNAHIVDCEKKTTPLVTPFEIYPESYWKSNDTPPDPMYLGEERVMALGLKQRPNRSAPRYLSHPLAWHDKCGPRPVVDPPSECPIYGCREPLFGLSPSEVLGHFEAKHGGTPQKMCPLCHLSFEVTTKEEREANPELAQWGSRREQVAHMECHVFQLWDILAGRKIPPPVVQEPFHPFHSLWNPGDEMALDRRDKRCPHFQRCGAMVGFMSQEQWNKHMETAHGVEDFGLLYPRDHDADIETALEARTKMLEARRKERIAQGKRKAPNVTEARTTEEAAAASVPSVLTHRPAQGSTQAAAPPAQASAQASAQATAQASAQVTGQTSLQPPPQDTPQVITRAPPQVPPQAPPQAPATVAPPPIARAPVPVEQQSPGPEDSEADPDRMVVERTQTSSGQQKTPVRSRRPDVESGSGASRSKSSGDSSGVSKSKSTSANSGGASRSKPSSGSGTANTNKTPSKSKPAGKPTPKTKPTAAKPAPVVFVPEEDMFCSRCFRKAPPKNPKRPKKGEPDRQMQMNAHSDPKRSCRIAPQEGQVTYDSDGKPELPSRVGWIRRTNAIIFKDLKNEFIAKYPTLERTMCPTDGSATRSVHYWQHDPNNESNSNTWQLPFPPEDGDDEDEDDNDNEGTGNEGDDDEYNDNGNGDDGDDEDDGESGPYGSDSDGGEDGGDDRRRRRRRSQMYRGAGLPRDPTYEDRGEEDNLSEADPGELVPESDHGSDTASAGEKRKRDLDKTQDRTPKRPKTAPVQGEEETREGEPDE